MQGLDVHINHIQLIRLCNAIDTFPDMYELISSSRVSRHDYFLEIGQKVSQAFLSFLFYIWVASRPLVAIEFVSPGFGMSN